jgi:tetratricopeptide (TPR) repeat protein/4-amino-4-deoxy-L-arabinose transferase-like glycosyltransferase
MTVVKTFPSMFRYPELLAIVLLFSAAAGSAVTDDLIYTPDSARYVVWAKSIADGEGFTDRTAPEPSRYVVHAPLYSVVMAPVAAAAHDDITALKYATVALGAVLLVLLFFSVIRTGGRIAAGAVTACAAFNPLTLIYSTQVLSDILFAVILCTLFLVLARMRKDERMDLRTLSAVILLLAGGIFSREVGIVLAAVVITFLLIRGESESAGWVFVGVIMLWGMWYVRNEVIIAGREQPDLRNSVMFVSNILTPNDAPLFLELWARVSVNGPQYARELIGLITHPQFSLSGDLSSTFYQVVNRTSPEVQTAALLVAPAFILISGCTMLMVGYGLFREFRDGTMAVPYLLFLLFYIGIILVYPVFDLRFLYPVLLVLLLLFGRGIGALLQNAGRARSAAVGVALFIMMLPNILWGTAFISEARAYAADPSGYYDTVLRTGRSSTEYSKPLPMIASWMRNQQDSTTVLISRWKELGILLPEKKVLRLDSYVSVQMFEQSIRDYGVRFLVTAEDIIGWHEFESQMNSSKRYSFRRVHTAAGMSVFRIDPVTADAPKSVDTKPMFRYLFHQMGQGNTATLGKFFSDNAEQVKHHVPLQFYHAVTMEWTGAYDSASGALAALAGTPQGIALSRQAGFHQQIIRLRREAEGAAEPKARAEMNVTLAVNYWEMDQPYRALQFLNAAVREELNYLPAYSLFIYFSLLNQDTVNATAAYTALMQRFPQETVTPLFASLFSDLKELRSARTDAARSAVLLKLTDDYARLGLTESSLESLYQAYVLDRSNGPLAVRLAGTYEKKGLYYPALKTISSALLYHPDDQTLLSIRSSLLERY